MSDLRQASRKFMIEFIEIYKNSPCLWQIKSKDYSDRNKKDLAYAELVKKYKEMDPKADRSTVVKKINSFRTVYSKELNKINNSLKSGAGADEVYNYKPNLWYFENLHFLNDVEPARISKSTMDETEGENMDQTGVVEDETTLAEDNSEQLDITPMIIPQTPSAPVSRQTKRKLNPFEQASLETMQKVGKKIDSYKEDDSLDRFGKHVADRLRDVKPHQLKIAQKLISDVLFEADMESLNRFWKFTGRDVESFQHSGFPQYMNYRQDNTYQMQNRQHFNVAPQLNPPYTPEQVLSPGQSSYSSENSVNVPQQPNPSFTPEEVFSPRQLSYTSENSVKEYVNSFNPNKK